MRDDVLDLLDHLGPHRVSLVRHSMGGAVAYLIAEKEPDRIDRLILEDTRPPSPRTRAIPQRPAATARPAMPGAVHRQAPAGCS
jgi:3-oxoadipate enol-lactonase